jgi:hypothetical protein
MNKIHFKVTWPVGVYLMAMLACSLFEAPAFPDPQITPLAQQVALISVPFNENGDAPKYELSAEIPALQGSDDPRAADFNSRMLTLVQTEMETFKRDLQGRPPMSDLDVYSSLDENYTQISPAGIDLLSLKLVFAGYTAGAAHPYEYTRTVNYDLQRGRELALAELFLPGSTYLEGIAVYCKTYLAAHLQYSEGDPFEQGSDPLPENYRNWNAAPDGLLITFDIYQVAPYVSGPQTVLVPYRALADVIDPQGPLAEIVQ